MGGNLLNIETVLLLLLLLSAGANSAARIFALSINKERFTNAIEHFISEERNNSMRRRWARRFTFDDWSFLSAFEVLNNATRFITPSFCSSSSNIFSCANVGGLKL